MSFKKEHRLETIIYLGLWGLLFLAPVINLSIRTSQADNLTFDWNEIFTVWKEYAVFFVVFLIHNHWLAPMLVYKQKIWHYLALCLTIVIIFQVYQYNHRPKFREFKESKEFRESKEFKEFREPREPREFKEFGEPREFGESRESKEFREPREFGEPREFREFREPREFGEPREFRDGPDFREPPGGPEGPRRPDDGEGDFDGSPGEESRAALGDSTSPLNDTIHLAQYRPDDYRPKPLRGLRSEKHPPLIFGQHDIISIIILILMLGMNLGIKLYFKQRSDSKKLDSLEKQSLEQQLEYLKYQINPHFFMNTLNNIHALVDIDPEKAKETILELSKMMRFVLYEGNKKGVPLDREIAFLQNYITLMKLRYTDKVRITVDLPQKLPNKEVPPLMFITFVENAFKHGVSYRQASFIDISIGIEAADRHGQTRTESDADGGDQMQKLVFQCRNSKIPASEDKHGGVGLTNVKQRLDLIYGSDYMLDIKDEAETYTVNLTITL